MSEPLTFPHWLYHPKLEPRVFQSQAELDAAEEENPGWQDSPAKCRSLTVELAEKLLPYKRGHRPKFTRVQLTKIKDFEELLRIAKNRKIMTEREGHGLSRKDVIDMIIAYQEQEAKKA